MPRSNAYGRDTAPVTVNYSGFIAPRLLDAGRRESSSVGCGSKFQDALLIPSPVRRERDRVRDICAARFSDAPHIARGSRFRIRTLYGSASYLCVIPTEAEGPRIIF